MFRVVLPYAAAFGLDLLAALELRKQERREHVGGKIAGAEVNPGIFIDHPTEELVTISALLADDLGALDEFGVVHDQRAAFAARDVFGLVKTLRGQSAERSGVFAAIAGEEAMSVVFHDFDAMTRRHIADHVHFAAYSGIVHGNDGF